MAVIFVEDKGSVRRKRKRNITFERKKIDVNEKIEVRSVEEGFQGSWHQATVIAWDQQECHVKYDHILLDDSTDRLVDIVAVSPVIEGIACLCENHYNYRGTIRQSPPKLEFSKWNLCYGLCVDVWYNDAWWEGVVLDYEDGSEKRRVFFPDLGDEMTVELENFRISQDWDDFKEEWRQRGTWMFLELIEHYGQEWFVSVSAQQLWYDLRERMAIRNVREWTFSCEALWKELVLEVIKDNHKITVNHFLKVSGLPGSSQPEPESEQEPAIPDADVNTSTDAHLGITFALVPAENQVNSTFLSSDSASIRSIEERSNSGQLVNVLKDDKSVLAEPNEPCVDEAVCGLPEVLLVSPSVAADGTCEVSSGACSEGFSDTDIYMAERRDKHSTLNVTATWKPADHELVSKAEPCPDAINKYVCAGRRPGNDLTNDVKKHLLYQGWKMESKQDEKMVRWRYTSPTGVCYYSLYKVCSDLMKNSGKRICSNTNDVRVVEPNIKDLGAVEQKIKNIYFIEPEYCPQAILDWSKDELDDTRKSKRGDLLLKAKKHLSSLGWLFHYATRNNGQRYLCYTSPRGRTYQSLKEACKNCIKEGQVPKTDASPSTPVEKINVFEKIDCRLASKKLSSETYNMDIQRSLVPSDTEFENRSKKSYSKFEKKNLAKQERSRKPKRKRKDSLSYLASELVVRQADLPVEHTSTSRSKYGKPPAALIKLRENQKGIRRTRVLRSTKRVQQVVTPSSLHRNPRTVLSWLIDNDIVLPRSKVHYWRKEQRLKVEGRINRDGIMCKCCNKVHSLSGFAEHGGGDNHRPTAKIFLEDGRSLLDCQTQVIQKSGVNLGKNKNSRLTRSCQIDKNDDVCSVCHYGGELILCDKCPSSFHESCLGLKTVPDGDWFCPSCCCGICGKSKLKEDGAKIVDERVLTCAQCAHKYHVDCICSRGAGSFEVCAKGNWFCCKKCEEISFGLHELLGRPIPVGTDNLTWTLIKSMQPDTHDLDASDNEAVVDNYSKLKIALEVMHECFEPVKETHTGRDLVADIIFSRSSELNRLNFQGFYTILLERHDELIAVANIRIHGEKVAEMPLIGTRFQYRRLGMCSILMNELEKKLMELGVERLILPAVPDVLQTWTGAFGFSKMMPSERLQFINYTFLDFQGAVMCQKLLLKRPLVESNLLIGSQFELHSDAFESCDNVGEHGSDSVCEVSQARHIKENQIMDHDLLEIDEAGGIGSNQNQVQVLVPVNQPTQNDNVVDDLECSVEERKGGRNSYSRPCKRRMICVNGR